MRKQTYGRRTNAASALTARCFFGGSPACATNNALVEKAASPRKHIGAYGQPSDVSKDEAIPIPLPDSPASNTRSRTKMRETEDKLDSTPSKKRTNANSSESVNDLSSKMCSLNIEREDSVAALRQRDLNSIDRPRKGCGNKLLTRDEGENGRSSEDDLSQALEQLSVNEIPEHTSPRRSPEARKETARVGPRRVTKATKAKKKTNVQTQNYVTYTKPLLDLCGDPKGRRAPTSFHDWADNIATYFRIVKIAEASYGEVYRLSLKGKSSTKGTKRAPQKQLGKADESVLKIIALKPPSDSAAGGAGTRGSHAAAHDMSAVADVASEVRVLRHLSAVPGFTNFREIRVVQGRVPAPFVRAWRAYNRDVKASFFADPGLKGSYDENQLWAIVEMQDAGTDVETLIERAQMGDSSEIGTPERDEEDKSKLTSKKDNHAKTIRGCLSVWSAWDIFWGVTLAVAKGEEYAGFEHRDLHMGNICIRSKYTAGSQILNPPLSTLDASRTIGYTGLETTLIDYTLSRAFVGSQNESSSTPSTPCPVPQDDRRDCVDEKAGDDSIAFFDLSKDETIFQGNASQDYQYEIYRYMRSAVMHAGDPLHDLKAQKGGSAANRHKRCGKKEAQGGTEGEDMWRQQHPVTNLVWLHFVLYKLIQGLDDPVATCRPEESSIGDGGEEVQELARELRQRLKILKGVLKLEKMARSEIRSAAELVQWALDVGWLAEADVIGLHDGEGHSFACP